LIILYALLDAALIGDAAIHAIRRLLFHSGSRLN
jgi:hypothetical protein